MKIYIKPITKQTIVIGNGTIMAASGIAVHEKVGNKEQLSKQCDYFEETIELHSSSVWEE